MQWERRDVYVLLWHWSFANCSQFDLLAHPTTPVPCCQYPWCLSYTEKLSFSFLILRSISRMEPSQTSCNEGDTSLHKLEPYGENLQTCILKDPCTRLPFEVVAEIFINCLPSSIFVAPNPRHAPILLSQVSASWRSICFSTPRLWSSLSIELRRRARNTGLECEKLMMVAWLSRAGTCPLSISMASDTAATQDFLDTFFSFSFQWRHVKINSLAPAEFPQKLQVPVLETFELIVRDFSSEYDQQLSTILHWSSACGLRKICWVNSGHEYHRLGLNWSQLTHITLNTSMSVENCLDILEKSQALTHAAFQSVTAQSFPTSRDQICLSQLLSLGFRTDKNIASLLDALVLPNILEFLFIGSGIQGESWPQTSFLNLIDRSSCALKNLYLYYVPSTTEELLDCLRRTQSSLKALTVQASGDPIVTDEFLDELTATDGVCLCPKLQILALYDCISCSPGHVADMVRSRLDAPPLPPTDTQGVIRLEAVEMYDHEAELEALTDLKSRGLILKVYSRTGRVMGLSLEEELRLQNLEEDDFESILAINDSTTGLLWELGA